RCSGLIGGRGRRDSERTSDLALFGRKKETDAAPGAAGNGEGETSAAAGEDTGLDIHPDKAKKFFDYARTVHETTNYEYAVQLWLNGLRHDPGNVQSLESFAKSCQHFLAS